MTSCIIILVSVTCFALRVSFKMFELHPLTNFLCLLFSLPNKRGDATLSSSLAVCPVRGRVRASPALRSLFFLS